MQHLESHSLAVGLSHYQAARHIGISVNHAGSIHTAALSDSAVIRIENILNCKACACRAYEVTAAAVDTTLGVLIPHRVLEQLYRYFLRPFDPELCLCHKTRLNIIFCTACAFKCSKQLLIFDIAVNFSVDHID